MEEKIDEGIIKGAKAPEILKETNLSYMKDYICKISGKLLGTGFFCKIEYKNELIRVLMTNYHIIDDEYIESKHQIKIYINDKCKIIKADKSRIIYSSIRNKYDLMIIKIKEEDEIDNYLELDPNIYDDNSENIYKDELIYILHFPNSGEAMISYGCGLEKNNEYDMRHKCNSNRGSSGGPILNAVNNKIIAIHKACFKINGENKYNIGSFLKLPLNELNKNKYSNDSNKILKGIPTSYDEIDLRYIFVGKIGSGKTHIIYKLKGINDHTTCTCAGQHYALCLENKNKIYKIKIYDTCGQEYTFNNADYYYIKNSNFFKCFIFVYDITEEDTFNNIPYWIDICKSNVNNIKLMILVGNINNDKKKRKISYERGKKLSEEYGMKFHEVSCVTGENLNNIFELDYMQKNDYIKTENKIIEGQKKNCSIF